jgi:MFS family permease
MLLQTASGVGNWLGIIFAGMISDKKGRKLCFCVGVLMLNLTCLCT